MTQAKGWAARLLFSSNRQSSICNRQFSASWLRISFRLRGWLRAAVNPRGSRGACVLFGRLEPLPVKQQRVLHHLVQVSPAVAPGAQRKLMRESLIGEDLVQKLVALVEAVAVVVAAVKVEFEAGEAFRVLGQGERVFLLPIGFVEGRSERLLKHLGIKAPASLGGKRVGEPGQQRGAVRAGGPENVRMAHAQVQRSVAAHRRAANAAGLAPRDRTELPVDGRNQLLNEKVLIALAAVGRVHPESLTAVGHDHDELAHPAVSAQTVQDFLPSLAAPTFLVLEESVEEVES